MTEASVKALGALRSTDNLQWYLIPMIVFAAYIYLNEIERRNFSAVFLGVFLWGVELCWEQINGLVLHFSGYAPLWCTPGPTAYLIYAGINVEICIFFAVGALLLIKALPRAREIRLLWIPNRVFIPVVAALLAVAAEVFLNRIGMLAWAWRFWNWPHLWVIFINYCLPSIVLVWMHDNLSLRTKRRLARAAVFLALLGHIIFAAVLGWI